MHKIILLAALAGCLDSSDDLAHPAAPPRLVYHLSNVSITVPSGMSPLNGLAYDDDYTAPDLYLGTPDGVPLLAPEYTAPDQLHVGWTDAYDVVIAAGEVARVDVWDADCNNDPPDWVFGCQADPATLDPYSHVMSCSAYGLELYAVVEFVGRAP